MASLTDLFKAVLGICETPPLDGALWTTDGKQATIKLAEASALAPAGAAARLEGDGLPARVLIVHADGDEYLAIENRCTHIGHRRLDPVEGQRELRCCSVGHSVFDHEGSRVSGPAKDPLRLFPVDKRGDELVVTLA
jgi:nitrite reductase/ring-hydroxylating ferredoxin subunit